LLVQRVGFDVVAAVSACRLLLAGFLFGILFDPEDGGIAFLRSVGGLVPNYTTFHSRRYYYLLLGGGGGDFMI
jgi:hypothetical protein